MASQRWWNLLLQKICLLSQVWGGCNQFGGYIAVNIERLPTVLKIQIQNSCALEDKRIPQRFPSDHSQKNLIENFVDPVVSALAVHYNQRLRSPNFPSFVPLCEFKTSQKRNFSNILCHQSVSDCIEP